MFRFTIRDLLWLMVVVALAAALGVEHRRVMLAEMAWHYWEEKAQPRPDRELTKTTHISCNLMPLKEVADYLSQVHGTPITLDRKVNGDTQITCKVTNQTLKAGLEQMLSPHDLDFRINNGAIEICKAN